MLEYCEASKFSYSTFQYCQDDTAMITRKTILKESDNFLEALAKDSLDVIHDEFNDTIAVYKAKRTPPENTDYTFLILYDTWLHHKSSLGKDFMKSS